MSEQDKHLKQNSSESNQEQGSIIIKKRPDSPKMLGIEPDVPTDVGPMMAPPSERKPIRIVKE